MIFYSAATKGFYCNEIHGANIPSDCVQITKVQHESLLAEQSQGKQIVPDENGYPTAIVPLSVSATWEVVRAKRDNLLKNSDWSSLPDVNPKPSKEAWFNYRQALRDITETFETPVAVVWPPQPTE